MGSWVLVCVNREIYFNLNFKCLHLTNYDDSDSYYIRDICPEGYVFHHVPRSHTTGGGVGVVLKNNIKAEIQPREPYRSFEHLQLELKSSKWFLRLIVLYRPPSSSVSLFYDEFPNYLAHVATAPGYLLIVGDFNLHVDSQNYAGRQFTSFLHSFNLHQHVNGSTHINGHTLDLVITREEQTFIKNLLVFDPALSDHYMIRCNFVFSKSAAQERMLSFRRFRATDIDKFFSDLENSALVKTPLNDDLSIAIDQFNSSLQSVIDNYAPIIRRSVTIRPYATWFTDEIKAAKTKRRKLERRWRAENIKANRLVYTEQCRVVNDLIRSAKENHFSSIIESNRGDQRILFQAVNNLLYRKPTVRYPSITPDTALAEKLKSFFVDKIRLIRDSLPVPSAGILNNLSFDNYGAQSCPCEFTTFQRVSTDDIDNFIKSSRVKTCALDPLPAPVLTKCLPILLPVITDIVNRSLDEAFLPNSLKTALIIPLLKKPNLNPEDLNNFRPVSNLPFISKLIEKSVAAQLVQYIDDNSLSEKLQSAYKK